MEFTPGWGYNMDKVIQITRRNADGRQCGEIRRRKGAGPMNETNVTSVNNRGRENTGAAVTIPAGFRTLEGLTAVQAAIRLGYLHDERLVIIAFHPEALDTIWKDRRNSGFGGGWAYYFSTVLPAARQLQVDLADQTHVGTDVLVVDRQEDKIYVAPRDCAEEFLALLAGYDPPTRRCICARPLEGSPVDCQTCPARALTHPTTKPGGGIPKEKDAR